MDDLVTATGKLNGQSISTVVEANAFDADHGDFTATTLTQGRVSATAYNAPDGRGTHFGLAAHGVLSVEVTQSTYGPRIVLQTEAGQMVTIDLFSVRDEDGERAKLPITFA